MSIIAHCIGAKCQWDCVILVSQGLSELFVSLIAAIVTTLPVVYSVILLATIPASPEQCSLRRVETEANLCCVKTCSYWP